MHTYKLTLCYDGANYAGWQVQRNATTVQETLETALATIVGERVRVVASGRTDAGVHALGQVVSGRFATRLEPPRLHRALNGNLPEDIRVVDLAIARDDFHALRDARRKTYRYVIQDGPQLDVFRRGYCWYWPKFLDVGAMRQAADMLVGRHDFASFQTAGSERATTCRSVERLTVARVTKCDNHLINCEITADGFLYNMVRNIVGTLVEVGRGARPANWIQEVLAARDRRVAGPTAPPQGLFLVNVEY